MKRLVFLTVCLVVFVANGFAQSDYKGEKGVSSVGVILGYAVENETAVFGVDYRYNIKDRIRLAPSILYTVKNDDNRSTWYVNADAHYLMRVTDKMTIYPVGGLGLSIWNFDNVSNEVLILKDSYLSTDSETKIRLGLNLGFGGEMRLTRDLIVGAEFRYNLTIRHDNQAMILTRAAYYF
ncbi:MAG: porin family protein [Tannerella sp.]|jgi:opacity protein-like surface antigen|nr:porin family protein [Tannerella sp.]